MSSFPPPLLVHKTLGKFLETKLRMAQAGKGGHKRGGEGNRALPSFLSPKVAPGDIQV